MEPVYLSVSNRLALLGALAIALGSAGVADAQSSGGPDAGGYTWTLASATDWDSRQGAARIRLRDDQTSQAVPIGFQFQYFGAAHQQVFVSSNGFLAFSNQPNGCCSGQRLPNSGSPSHLIAGFWEDLNPSRGGVIWYATRGASPNRRFIVSFDAVPHYSAHTPVTFQMVLYEGSNNFDIRLRSVASDSSRHSIGWEDRAGTRGTSVRYGRLSFRDTVVQVVANPGIAGGDTYGYVWTQTQYDFEDISGGTELSLGDDAMSAAVNMGFEFRFYDATYAETYVSSNGFLSFLGGSNAGCCSGQVMPNTDDPDGIIAGFWEDLNPAAGGHIYYDSRGASPNRRFIVQYEDVPHSPSGNLSTFQIVLYEGRGHFEIRHLSTTSDGGNHAAGFEDQSGQVGSTIMSGNFAENQRAWRVTAPVRRDGPDSYGYVWRSTPYSYESINGSNRLVLRDDQTSGAVPIGFDFDYYGDDRSQVYVSSNGFLTFLPGQTNACCTGRPMPQGAYANGMIAGLWEDLNPSRGGQIWYDTRGTAPNRRFILEFENVPHYPSTLPVTFQIVLFEASGDFEIRHQHTVSDSGAHSVGFENDGGNDGLMIAYGNVAFDERAWRVYNPLVEGTGGPYDVAEYATAALRGRCDGCVSFSWDFDDDGAYDDATGQVPTFSAVGIDGPTRVDISMRGCDAVNVCRDFDSYIDVINVAPSIISNPVTVAARGQVYSYTPVVTDPAGSDDPLQFFLLSAPQGATIDPDTGLVEWTPGSQSGATIEIRAVDDDGGFTTQRWDLRVVNMGPDNFGYTWAPSTYDWEDTSSGSSVRLSDDAVSGAVPIGFAFDYYGRTYSDIRISSNGFITFLSGQSNGCCSGQQTPSRRNPNGVIAGLWEDLNPSTGGTIRYATRGTAPNRRFVMTFDNVNHYPRTLPVTFQIVLFEGIGHFEIRHQHVVSDTGRHSVGFENHDGTDGLSIGYGQIAGDNLAYRITAPGGLEITDENVVASGQPEHVDYEFSSSTPGNWKVSLFRYFNGSCASEPFVFHEVDGTDNVTGMFAGLTAGERYCYSSIVGVGSAMEQVTGEVQVPEVVGITDGPSASNAGLNIDINAAFADVVSGSLEYRGGTCASDTSSVIFDGGQKVTMAGHHLPSNDFTVQLWARSSAATQNSTLFEAVGGNFSITLSGGVPTAHLTTTNGSATTMPLGATGQLSITEDSLLTVTYDGSQLRLYVNGGQVAGSVLSGDVASFDWSGVSGPKPYIRLGNGFRGKVSSLALHRRVLSFLEVDSTHRGGAVAELPISMDTVGAWWFDEASNVQVVYDVTGGHWSGWLGILETVDSADPQRSPVPTTTVHLGDDDAFAHTLSGLTGGPSYCYRMVGRTAAGVVASPWQQFTRTVDTTPPSLTGPPTVVNECTGNEQARFVLTPPAVQDDYDSSPTLVATVANNVIAMPHTFDLGSTVVVWRATDDAGNVGTLRQTVQVLDTTNPQATGGPLVTIEAEDPDGTLYAPEPAQASDSCSDIDLDDDAPATFALGTRRVHFTVTDTSGNETLVSRDFLVQDTTAPSFDDNPLPLLRMGHPGVSCFEFAPPTPAFSDNGYANDRITVNVTGVPDCWQLGQRTITWRLSDPAGNARDVNQSVSIEDSSVNVSLISYTINGTAIQVGRYYNAPVVMTFDVTSGVAPFDVQVSPEPASLTNNGARYTATFDADGAYGSIVVLVSDAAGAPGAGRFPGFGIDTTPPTITFDRFMDEDGYSMADPASFPWVFAGERRSAELLYATDGASAPDRFGQAAWFDTQSTIDIPASADFELGEAFTAEVWAYIPPEFTGLLFGRGVGETFDFAVWMDPTAVIGIVRAGDGEDILEYNRGVSPGWHHFAVSKGQLLSHLWIDGEPVESDFASGPMTNNVQRPITLAGAAGSALTQFALHRRSFSRHEMMARYAGGRGRAVEIDADTAVALRFDDDPASQLLNDATGNEHHGLRGGSIDVDPGEPELRAIAPPADGAVSGLVDFHMQLERVGSMAVSPLVHVSASAAGTPLAVGPRALNGPCDAPVGSACNAGERDLRVDLVQLWSGQIDGAYVIRITARDAAGNETTAQVPFQTGTLRTAMESSLDRIELERDLYGQDGLDDAHHVISTGHAYLGMSRPYTEGAFLTVTQAMMNLEDAYDVGADTEETASLLARALRGDILRYVEGLSSNGSDDDAQRIADALEQLDLAWYAVFYEEPGMAVEFSREAYDSVAMLYPPYQAMRSTREAAFARWENGLTVFAAGSMGAQTLQVEQSRMRQIQRMLGATRDVLRDVLYPEISAAMDNQFTTERRSMQVMKDLINRESNDPGEVGDLVAVTDLSVDSACIDRLTLLDLDDDEFTRCYMRLNEVIRELGEVSESLVHTHRWRTGLALATFNMLSLTLEIGPTAVPWVASMQAYPGNLDLVLPDDQAAQVAGSIPLSTVDAQDGLLTRAYADYYRAVDALEEGDIDAAFAQFFDSRCSVIAVYNRYYSTNNLVPNVAAPAEAPIAVPPGMCD